MMLASWYRLEKVSGNLRDDFEYRITGRSGKVTAIDQSLPPNKVAILHRLPDPFSPNNLYSLRLDNGKTGQSISINLSLYRRLGQGIGDFNTKEKVQVFALVTKTFLELFIYKTFMLPTVDGSLLSENPFSRYWRRDKKFLAEIATLRNNATVV